MNELSELMDYCIDHSHWLSVNYSPFDKSYQIYVNPGRTMSSAKRHKTLEDAVRSCWIALGAKPKYEWANVSEKKDRKNSLDYSNATTIMAPYCADKVNELLDKSLGNTVVTPKRRGRPKGSKNKPKVVAE